MIRTYLKLSLRDLTFYKGYSIINLLGLVIGITAFALIILWIRAETSYDTFHKHANDIYRVDYLLYEEEVLEQHSASGSKAIGKEMMKTFPEVVDYTRFYRAESLVKYGDDPDEIIKERDLLYAQSSFFNVFSFPLLEGVADSSILALGNAVITEECARKYFGHENPMGKVLKIDGRLDYVISGVFKSIPGNSHFSFDILLSYENLVQLNRRVWDDSWWGEDVYTYVLLAPGADVDALQEKLPQIPEAFLGDFMKRAFFLMEFRLIKLTDIHLHSSVSNELKVNGSQRNVNALGIIAFLVLLIAYINYINLATSRSVERAHEVGLRKVNGALNKDLISQFLTESALLNLLALIVSFTVVFLLLPFFKESIQSPLQLTFSGCILLFLALFATGTLFTGFLSTLYSTSFPASIVQRDKIPSGKGKWIIGLKNALVVFQFAISIILIIGTITISRQINYMMKHDLGFSPEGLVVLEGPRILQADSYESYMLNLEAFENDLGTLAMVSNVTASSNIPGKEIKQSMVFGIPVEGRNTEKKIEMYFVDNRFFDTYDIKLRAGDNFSSTFRNDSVNIIINEAALPYFGFTDADSTIGDILRGSGRMVYVKAIVKDFNQEQLTELPQPIGFLNYPVNQFYTVKAQMSDIGTLISELEKIWSSHYPGNPFHYIFLDDFYNEQYEAEQRFSGLFLVSSLLAIIIACLGLLGLSAYSISRRQREIGIRKANGAGIARVIILLNKSFITWVVLAFIIACPLAWLLMSRWLQNFAYKAGLSWWIFAVAGVVAVLIALFTVSWHSWRAATKNPVEALRYE